MIGTWWLRSFLVSAVVRGCLVASEVTRCWLFGLAAVGWRPKGAVGCLVGYQLKAAVWIWWWKVLPPMVMGWVRGVGWGGAALRTR